VFEIFTHTHTHTHTHARARARATRTHAHTHAHILVANGLTQSRCFFFSSAAVSPRLSRRMQAICTIELPRSVTW